MNILITNDDGIQSDGIRRLAAVAVKFGEVWVIAPDGQRSAMSHRITLHSPIDVWPVEFPVEGVHAYATSGTPADCVRFGIRNIVKAPVDAVLTGINVGHNIGSDIQYSATAGSALEAATSDILAIAFSEGIGPNAHIITDLYLEELMREYLQKPLTHDTIWNINFPDCTEEEFKGILRDRRVAINSFFNDSYAEELLPNGGLRLNVAGALNYEAEEGTDFHAILNQYISIGTVQNLTHA